MIRVKYVNGGPALVVAMCDRCGKQITKASPGVYEWLPEEAEKPAGAEPRMFHQGACAGERDHDYFYNELRNLPVYLAHNLDDAYDWDATVARIKDLNSIGL